MSDKDKKITVLNGYRPLTDEELSAELTPRIPDEEMSAELAPNAGNVVPLRRVDEDTAIEDDKDVEEKSGSGLALTGVILSALSLFFMPYLLSTAGIILGYLGYKRGDKSLGIWAMGLGAIGLLGTLIVGTFV